MSAERELEQRLRDLRVPDEGAAEERARDVVRAAYAERTPVRPPPRIRRAAVAVAVAAGLLAVGLSPAGARVADLVRDVVGAGDAEPVLTRLPAPGEMLVESRSGGVWIARADGSKRHLGDFEQATWSPRGLFVAATRGRELAALDPAGEVRWSLARPRPLSDPRWSEEPGYRIAYRAGSQLRVVAGDGTGDRLLERDVAQVAPAWRPVGPGQQKGAGPGPGTHVLAFVRRSNRVRVIDADRGTTRRIPIPPFRERPIGLEWSSDGAALMILGRDSVRVLQTAGDDSQSSELQLDGRVIAGAVSPDGERVAITRRVGNRGELLITSRRPSGAIEERVLTAARQASFDDVTWSPDGRWLVVSWREADQWLFIRPDRPARKVAVADISRQFDPNSGGEPAFPSIAGWILPERP